MNTSIITAAAPMKVVDVANCFIKIANSQIVQIPEAHETVIEGITHLKLQKLLYFAQAAHLALYKQPLFNEDIEAWDFGPVVPVVYHKYKSFANKQLDLEKDFSCPEDKEQFLKDVWNIFGKYSATELVNMSHRHDPWKKAYKEGEHHILISNESILQFYKDAFA